MTRGFALLLPLAFTTVLPIVIPLGLQQTMPVPAGNPLTQEGIDLGRKMFFDKRLSRDGTVSCATCHDPERAFADTKAIAVGIDGREGRRHSPAIVNRGFGRGFFWDGRATTLEEQVLMPIGDPNEMDSSAADAAARVGLSSDDLARALASYVRSLMSGNSPFDRFKAGDPTALSADEQLGRTVFERRARCSFCHIGPNFTDEQPHNTGVAFRDGELKDLGYFARTNAERQRGAFKTATLREVARTAPYMHDGSLATLEDVVEFYDRGGNRNPNSDVLIRPINMTPEEKRTLVAFLKALSGDVYEGGNIVKK